ncbi:hypothetical protein HPC49_12710 [Pyxidicoccus fallax]|uniref:Lipoprotein n=1 Tax=Pyxidicoccus fallax TaxID=394095 RepID=A0A848LP96_9BACT|nr:hypothetical protein [Pyxidicoccus fallax]NMO19344.1 hypothetical protein [Pyxidicoccus fallax]NPC79096.1 hypothetical protein [Pyxidicoccus fallax]
MSRFHRMAWVTLGLGVLGGTGCAHHKARVAEQHVEEAEKCQLVRSVLQEPEPSRLVNELASDGREEPAPVVVYVRRPEQAMLERFFRGDEPVCGDTTFKVVQENVLDAVVVYLQEVQDGYAYDARRASPQELSMDGKPQGLVKRAGPAWVAGPGPI